MCKYMYDMTAVPLSLHVHILKLLFQVLQRLSTQAKNIKLTFDEKNNFFSLYMCIILRKGIFHNCSIQFFASASQDCMVSFSSFPL